MYKLKEIINKKVVAIKGFRLRKDLRKKNEFFEPVYILLDDRRTLISFDEQDYYTYHDCSTKARHIEVIKNKKLWNEIMIDDEQYPNANIDI
jgi:hypothetical protein